MMTQHSPKQQHYVPRFLLKGFASGKHEQVWAYDKQTDRVFRTAIGNAAVQNKFYDLTLDWGTVSAEAGLGDLEAKAAPLVNQIRRERQIGFLTPPQRETLALFLAVQRVRTINWRKDFEAAGEKLRERVRRFAEHMGADADNTPGVPKAMTADDIKRAALLSLRDAHEAIPYLLAKPWVLFSNETSLLFYTSDNPVALHNAQDHGFYGNLGYGSPGIEIYLPISSTLCLGMICDSHEEKAREIMSTAALVMGTGAPIELGLRRWIEKVETLTAGMEQGTPVPSSRDNVLHQNSLQVIRAERYVYAAKEQFALVSEMLKKNPRLRTGPRMTVS